MAMEIKQGLKITEMPYQITHGKPTECNTVILKCTSKAQDHWLGLQKTGVSPCSTKNTLISRPPPLNFSPEKSQNIQEKTKYMRVTEAYLFVVTLAK